MPAAPGDLRALVRGDLAGQRRGPQRARLGAGQPGPHRRSRPRAGPGRGADAGAGAMGRAPDPAGIPRLHRDVRAPSRRRDPIRAAGDRSLEPRRGDTYNLGFLYGTLAFAYRDAGKGNDAFIAAERSLRIMEQPGFNPEGRRFWVGQNYLTIGTVLRSQKKFAEAKVAMEKGLARQRQLYGDSPTSVLMLMNLGQNARQSGDLPAALGYYREAADLQIKKGGGRVRVNRDLPGLYLDAIDGTAQATPADRPDGRGRRRGPARPRQGDGGCAPAHGDAGRGGQPDPRRGDAGDPGHRAPSQPGAHGAGPGAGSPARGAQRAA